MWYGDVNSWKGHGWGPGWGRRQGVNYNQNQNVVTPSWNSRMQYWPFSQDEDEREILLREKERLEKELEEIKRRIKELRR